MASTTTNMSSCRPYLLKALYNWIIDNQMTPYLLVKANLPQVQVPQQYVQEGKIILNIAPLAVKDLNIDPIAVKFSARFNNVVQQVYVPIAAVLGIYTKENGRGMFFDAPEFTAETEQYAKTTTAEVRPLRQKPQLTVVRSEPPKDDKE
jgi:stringent starvation protein B